MECNKDEALRAKEIAERKVTEKDYLGAKKFALKAKSLYPPLDDLPQVLSTIDIYVSAENRINGEADWYGVLGVDPLADDETLRKQYRKLALMLHPDKNKCRGADGAFKLVSEAWSLLSDKTKRSAYNHKRSLRGTQQKFCNETSVPSHPPNVHKAQKPKNSAATHARAKATGTSVETSSFSSARPGTFWTICTGCRTQFEYLRVYLNHTLICSNCNEAFTAMEKAPPHSVHKSGINFTSHRQNQKRHQAAARNPYNPSGHSNASNDHSFRWNSFSNMTGVNGDASAQAASVVQEAEERVKRGFEESRHSDGFKRMPSYTHKAERPFKKPRSEIFHADNPFSNNRSYQIDKGIKAGFRYSSGGGNQDTSNPYPFAGFPNTPKRVLTAIEVRNAVKTKGQAIIYNKLKNWSSEGEKKLENAMKKKSKKSIDGSGPNKTIGSAVIEEISADSKVENHEPVVINVPDSDFHNFDLDRSESSFGDDQVWAAYDDDDGMPRFYARIQKVISRNPFEIRISWLNSKTNSEFSSIDWVSSGFTKTCGDFRAGKYENSNTLNSFSHKVKFMKGTRGLIRILPQKGEVWALYRNWSADWDENTPDEVIHKYDMVEVLDDYTDEHGVTVIPLVKVADFVAIFRADTNQNDVKKIPKEEMFRFSHQVPSYVLTGKEADNAPEGFRELDPAATPLDLLQENAQEIKEASEKEKENGKTELSKE